MNEQQPTKETLHRFYLPVSTIVISLKGGIPKIWGETLLLLLLGIDIPNDNSPHCVRTIRSMACYYQYWGCPSCIFPLLLCPFDGLYQTISIFSMKCNTKAFCIFSNKLPILCSIDGCLLLLFSTALTVLTACHLQVKLVWYYNNALGRPKKKKFIARSKS
jgi:hypothetical protein